MPIHEGELLHKWIDRYYRNNRDFVEKELGAKYGSGKYKSVSRYLKEMKSTPILSQKHRELFEEWTGRPLDSILQETTTIVGDNNNTNISNSNISSSRDLLTENSMLKQQIAYLEKQIAQLEKDKESLFRLLMNKQDTS